MSPTDDEFLKQSRKILDDSIESLDAATLSRLNQARQKALQSQSSATVLFTNWLPATAFVSLSVIAATLWLWIEISENRQQNHLAYQYEDMEILTSDTELELLEQLEFVGWLVELDQGVIDAS